MGQDMTKKILIVDPDKQFSQYLAEILRVAEYFVSTAEGEMEALQMIHSNEPHVVLINTVLEEGSGQSLLKKIVTAYANVICVMTSAVSSIEDAIQYMRDGAFDYIPKPIQLRKLHQILNHCFEKVELIKSREKAENRFKNFFNQDLTYNFIANTEGRILLANFGFASLMGKNHPDEVIGSEIKALFKSESKWERIIRILKMSGSINSLELDLPLGENENINLLGNLQADVEDNNIEKIYGFFVDITKYKEMEYHLNQSVKMEAIGLSTNSLAHEFNNILTSIMGTAELLLTSMPDFSDYRTDLEEVMKAAEKGAEITKKLKNLAMPKSPTGEKLNPDAFIISMADTFEKLIGPEIKMHLNIQDNHCVCEIGNGELEQILINLILNAKEAMPASGTLTLSSKIEGTAPGLSESPKNGYLVLSVADNGVGIPFNIGNKVFDPFFTTKSRKRGAGLGLSIAYNIVKQCGGVINFDTAMGLGTTFNVYLPVDSLETDENIIED